jgi:hypothetical protein
LLLLLKLVLQPVQLKVQGIDLHKSLSATVKSEIQIIVSRKFSNTNLVSNYRTALDESFQQSAFETLIRTILF